MAAHHDDPLADRTAHHHRWERHDERLPVDPDLAPDDPGAPSRLHHPVPGVHRARQHDVIAAIAAGGFLGTVGRYEVGLAWSTPAGHVPWSTLAVNTSGAFLLGLSLMLLLERVGLTGHVRPFFCVGVLGAWTTMSAFALETDMLVRDGHLLTAAVYVLATIVSGVVSTWLGVALARRLDTRRASWESR